MKHAFRLVEVPPHRSVPSHTPPERSPPLPGSKAAKAVRLQPISWGKPDRALGRAVCWHIRDAMPETVIPFNPFTHRKLRAYLREHGFTD